MYIFVCLRICVCVYINRERERERGRNTQREYIYSFCFTPPSTYKILALYKYFHHKELSCNEIVMCLQNFQSLHCHNLLCMVSTIMPRLYNPNKASCLKYFPLSLLHQNLIFIQNFDLCCSIFNDFLYYKNNLEVMIQVILLTLLVYI